MPLYLHRLGVEAYGLVGFCATVLISAQILELGLSQALTRELARHAGGQSPDARSLFLSLERLYLVLAAIFGGCLFLAAPLLGRVVGAAELPPGTVATALQLIAVLMALQLLVNLYVAGLLGLEQVKLAALLRAGTATLAAAGGVGVIYWGYPSVLALFAWFGAVAAGGALAARLLLASRLPGGAAAAFRPALVLGLWRFAGGMTAITTAAVLVSQLDRWLLIHLLPLGQFGYYALAASLAAAVNLIVSPLFGTLFPRFSFLAARDDAEGMRRVYSAATQALGATVVPLALTLSLFSHEVLRLWTRDAAVAQQASTVLSLLVLGSMLNGLMNVPYALHLALGNTRLVLAINLAGIAFLVPAILALAPRWGPPGAALAWLGFNVVFAALAVPITHRRLPRWGAARWLGRDVLPGAAAALLVLGAARAAAPATATDAFWVLYLGGALAASGLAAAACAVHTREWLVAQVRKLPYALR